MNSVSTSDDICRKQYYKEVDEYIKSIISKFREKTVITQVMHDRIIECLTNNNSSSYNARFISWCRTTFVIQNTGAKFLLYDSKTKKAVLIYESMYNVYKHTHIETAHAERDKCLDSLSLNYSWYNRKLLQLFIKNCSACQKRKPIVKPMLSKPIIALEFMARVQMDLIDMRTRPDAMSDRKVYRWILQLKDHFTKFCWAKPLEHKESREVYNCVREIFFMFGAPAILQSDNEREFVNELINSLQVDFPVHGRPRHPQSQGLIERTNAILTDALGKLMEDNSSNHWSLGLPCVIFRINIRSTHTTRKTPYQLVFGQNPRTNMSDEHGHGTVVFRKSKCL
ncbi:unnamed protein product [Rotaria magnacalcarata]|uniref:Integrase catalytic domain-containing protein n=1 Tax=Rotaria magnacalcarata TaxID=392030 RepID=A0A8S2KJE9_9BILA|nr:unnamed protein product [Rotaria magnacalcarata]CAF3855445.1 unnamed protein product [Rotaria magnacalcarata]CAF3972287.1 unnamed protein product [Rotaria magnacalcarata]